MLSTFVAAAALPTDVASRTLSAGVSATARPFAAEYLKLYRDTVLNVHFNNHSGTVDGHSWPPDSQAFSMAGQRRLDSAVALMMTAVTDGVPGHFLETGVWRGGLCFLV